MKLSALDRARAAAKEGARVRTTTRAAAIVRKPATKPSVARRPAPLVASPSPAKQAPGVLVNGKRVIGYGPTGTPEVSPTASMVSTGEKGKAARSRKRDVSPSPSLASAHRSPQKKPATGEFRGRTLEGDFAKRALLRTPHDVVDLVDEDDEMDEMDEMDVAAASRLPERELSRAPPHPTDAVRFPGVGPGPSVVSSSPSLAAGTTPASKPRASSAMASARAPKPAPVVRGLKSADKGSYSAMQAAKDAARAKREEEESRGNGSYSVLQAAKEAARAKQEEQGNQRVAALLSGRHGISAGKNRRHTIAHPPEASDQGKENRTNVEPAAPATAIKPVAAPTSFEHDFHEDVSEDCAVAPSPDYFRFAGAAEPEAVATSHAVAERPIGSVMDHGMRVAEEVTGPARTARPETVGASMEALEATAHSVHSSHFASGRPGRIKAEEDGEPATAPRVGGGWLRWVGFATLYIGCGAAVGYIASAHPDLAQRAPAAFLHAKHAAQRYVEEGLATVPHPTLADLHLKQSFDVARDALTAATSQFFAAPAAPAPVIPEDWSKFCYVDTSPTALPETEVSRNAASEALALEGGVPSNTSVEILADAAEPGTLTLAATKLTETPKAHCAQRFRNPCPEHGACARGALVACNAPYVIVGTGAVPSSCALHPDLVEARDLMLPQLRTLAIERICGGKGSTPRLHDAVDAPFFLEVPLAQLERAVDRELRLVAAPGVDDALAPWLRVIERPTGEYLRLSTAEVQRLKLPLACSLSLTLSETAAALSGAASGTARAVLSGLVVPALVTTLLVLVLLGLDLQRRRVWRRRAVLAHVVHSLHKRLAGASAPLPSEGGRHHGGTPGSVRDPQSAQAIPTEHLRQEVVSAGFGLASPKASELFQRARSVLVNDSRVRVGNSKTRGLPEEHMMWNSTGRPSAAPSLPAAPFLFLLPRPRAEDLPASHTEIMPLALNSSA